MVIAGHVHNYQRLTKYRHDGVHVPYLVTGAGGYHNLHHVRKVNGEHMIPPVIFHDNQEDPVHLEAYTDDHHGFLRVDVTAARFSGRYYQVPRPQEPYSKGSQLVDRFDYNWATKTYDTNTSARPRLSRRHVADEPLRDPQRRTPHPAHLRVMSPDRRSGAPRVSICARPGGGLRVPITAICRSTGSSVGRHRRGI